MPAYYKLRACDHDNCAAPGGFRHRPTGTDDPWQHICERHLPRLVDEMGDSVLGQHIEEVPLACNADQEPGFVCRQRPTVRYRRPGPPDRASMPPMMAAAMLPWHIWGIRCDEHMESLREVEPDVGWQTEPLEHLEPITVR